MQRVIGLPKDYAEMSDADKIRQLCGLPPAAPESAIVERLEAIVENRTYWQRVVLATTTQLRAALEEHGLDELTNPNPQN